MLSDVYEQLATDICAAGFFTAGVENRGLWERTTICSKRLPDGRLTGNSFWVTQLASRWYIGVWNGNVYRVPDSIRIADLCVSWLTREPEKTLGDVDEGLKRHFGLELITVQEFDRVTSTSA